MTDNGKIASIMAHNFARNAIKNIEATVFSPDELNMIVSTLKKDIKKIDKYSGTDEPRKITGYNLYFKEKYAGARKALDIPDGVMTKANKKKLFGTIGAAWKRLGVDGQAPYNDEASNTAPVKKSVKSAQLSAQRRKARVDAGLEVRPRTKKFPIKGFAGYYLKEDVADGDQIFRSSLPKPKKTKKIRTLAENLGKEEEIQEVIQEAKKEIKKIVEKKPVKAKGKPKTALERLKAEQTKAKAGK
jgi:hypothetical protein